MAGIIGNNIQGEAPDQPEQAAQPTDKQGVDFKSAVVNAIPQNLREAFTRIVLAGKAVLYDKNMQPEIQKQMSRNVPVWQKLAEGIAMLMKMLDLQSKKTMPQELLVPAAIELIYEYSDFLNQSGQMTVSPDDVHEATVYVAVAIMKIYGAQDGEIMNTMQQAAGGPAQEPTNEEQPGEEETPAEDQGENPDDEQMRRKMGA